MTSIKDVARLAGVSVSTVSRVLRGVGPVDEDTRRRIEQSMEAINYRPSPPGAGYAFEERICDWSRRSGETARDFREFRYAYGTRMRRVGL